MCGFASLWRYNEDDPCAVGYYTDCQLLAKHWISLYSRKPCVQTSVLTAWSAAVEERMTSIDVFSRPHCPSGFYLLVSGLFFPGSVNAPFIPYLFHWVLFLILCLLFGAVIISQNILKLSFCFAFLFIFSLSTLWIMFLDLFYFYNLYVFLILFF